MKTDRSYSAVLWSLLMFEVFLENGEEAFPGETNAPATEYTS
jgi:hypothetical protein